MKLVHILSNHLFPIFFGLPLPLLRTPYSYQPLAPPHWVSVHLLLSLHMPNPSQSRFSHLVCTGVSPTFSRVTSFLILSLLVCPHIHLNILISTTCIFWTCDFLIGQHSTLYNTIDLITTF
uniref:Putative ovule protein n=1 Tax=Solanum chacoense TaxID=4108 RepID=A0A0V0HMJ8_SOLCH